MVGFVMVDSSICASGTPIARRFCITASPVPCTLLNRLVCSVARLFVCGTTQCTIKSTERLRAKACWTMLSTGACHCSLGVPAGITISGGASADGAGGGGGGSRGGLPAFGSNVLWSISLHPATQKTPITPHILLIIIREKRSLFMMTQMLSNIYRYEIYKPLNEIEINKLK